MSARDAILARLHGKTAPVPAPDVSAWYAGRRRQEELPQRIARLREGLEAAHAEVILTTALDWPNQVVEIAQAKGISTLLLGADTPFAPARPDGLNLRRYNQAIDHWKQDLFDSVDASVTHARSAIAETGTLILWPDANEPRLMSLVPPVHFVVLDARTIHADFHDAITSENWPATLPTNALLISGPSKTADIQQTLAYGAHGPRELIVLVAMPEGGAP